MSGRFRRTVREFIEPPTDTSLATYAGVKGFRWLGTKIGGRSDTFASKVTVYDHHIENFKTTVPVRLYDPTTDTNQHPVIVYLHGGGWIVGNLNTNQRLCALLAEESGHVVVSVDYRLAPEHRYPAAIQDCLRVLEWISIDGPDYGIDPDGVQVFGASAGGTLAAALHADTAIDLPLSIVHQTLVYPPLDPLFDERQSNTSLLRRFAQPAIRGLWNLYLPSDTDRTKPQVAPLRAREFDAVPPTTIVTCGLDPLRAEGRVYVRQLTDAGVPVAHVTFPHYPHGVFTVLPLISRRRTLAALQRVRKAASELRT